MFTTLYIAAHERAVLVRQGLPVRALAPGSHVVWAAGLAVHRLDTDELVVTAPAPLRAVLPPAWTREVRVADGARAVILRGGAPVRVLGPGVHRVWAVDPAVEVRLEA